MIRGLYISSSGMKTHQIKQNMIADNMANINTPGFKSGTVAAKSFPEMLMAHMGTGREIGSLSTGVKADETKVNFSQGAFQNTGRDLDLSISGEGFFKVQDADGDVFYTRGGNFSIDNDKKLVTQDGLLVLDQRDESITVDGEFLVHSSGVVQGANHKLALTKFVDKDKVLRVGSGLWVTDDSNVVEDKAARILQGILENSNVEMEQEMTNLIAVSRAYQANARVFSTIDDTLSKAVNEIAKL